MPNKYWKKRSSIGDDGGEVNFGIQEVSRSVVTKYMVVKEVQEVRLLGDKKDPKVKPLSI